MRLIDADALIVEIKTCLWDWESVNGIESKTVLNQTITDIENMPTIDAVPVIRCKDCKYWHREIYNGIEYFNFSSCDLNHHGDGRNFYCADAERKEE